MKKFSIRFPVRIAAFLMMLTILCCSPAYADSNLGVGEISAAEQTLLYTQYEAIAAEVSAESGYAIHVRPLGEMDSFLTASQFRQEAEEFARILSTEQRSVSAVSSSVTRGENGNGPWQGTVEHTQTRTYESGSIIVNIKFTGLFNVIVNGMGGYKLDSWSIPRPIATTNNSEFYLVYDGDFVVTRIDSGRTIYGSQDFIAYYGGYFYTNMTCGVHCTFNKTTGKVTMY